MWKFKAENGETIIAKDETQKSAFENAGLKLVSKAKEEPKDQEK